MKYLHIMHNTVFISSYIRLINENFNLKEHKFLVINGVEEEEIFVLKAKNIVRYRDKKNSFKILKIIKIFIFLYKNCKNNVETIYFHSLFDKRIMLFLFIFRSFLKKSNWIIWGGDLYCYEKRRKGLKYFLWYKIEDYVKRNFTYINTLVPQDYKIAKKYYKVKGRYKEAVYPEDLNSKIPKQLPLSIKDSTYIQVGNSADPTNNHFEILDTLKKFKNENIKIFCILSYGDKEHGKKVNEYGIKNFGDKFIGIFDFMPIDEYWNYLKDIDILIFNHRRQQGLGNISMIGYLEKKIYMRDDISSWDYLTKNINLTLNSYENIKYENFETFTQNNCKGNKEKLQKTYFSKEFYLKIWEKNFKNN